MLNGTSSGDESIASGTAARFCNGVSPLVNASSTLLFSQHSSFPGSSRADTSGGMLGFGCSLGGNDQHNSDALGGATVSTNAAQSQQLHTHAAHDGSGLSHSFHQNHQQLPHLHHHLHHPHHHQPGSQQQQPPSHLSEPQPPEHHSSLPSSPTGPTQSLVPTSSVQHHHHHLGSLEASLEAVTHQSTAENACFHQQPQHHHHHALHGQAPQQTNQLALHPSQTRHSGVSLSSNLGPGPPLMPSLSNAAATAAAFILASPSLLGPSPSNHNSMSPQSLAMRGKKVSRAEPIPKSGFKGVSWNTRMKAWLAFYTNETGDRKSKTFSTRKLGMEEARMQAIAFCRQKQDQRREARRRNRELHSQQCCSTSVLEKLSSDDSLVLDSSPGSLRVLDSWGAPSCGAGPAQVLEHCTISPVGVHSKVNPVGVHGAAPNNAVSGQPCPSTASSTNHVTAGSPSPGSLPGHYLPAPPQSGRGVSGAPSSMIGDSVTGGVVASPYLSSTGAGSPGSPGSPSRLAHTPIAPPQQGSSEVAYVPIVPIAMDMIEKSGLLQPLELNVLPPCQHCNKQPYPFLMIVSEGQEHTYGAPSAEKVASSSQGEVLLDNSSFIHEEHQREPLPHGQQTTASAPTSPAQINVEEK